METLEEDIETLTLLGLTHSQAKIYLTMIKSGLTKAKKISEITGIARPHVYIAMEKLEKKGLIEKAIDKPAKIKIFPLYAGIKILIHQKEKKDLKLAQGIERLILEFKQKKETDFQEPKRQFVWISDRQPYIEKRKKEINNTKKSIDFITTWKRFPRTMFTFCDVLELALKKNVNIRVILERIPVDSSLPSECYKLFKYPNYSLKFISRTPQVVIAFFDRKRMIIDTSSRTNLAEVPALWTDNPSLLILGANYFESLWKEAISSKKMIHHKELQ